MEQLSPRPDETSSPETKDMELHDLQDGMAVRVTYKSGNVYEGYMVKWVPSGEGRLFLHDGVTYKVILYVNYYCRQALKLSGGTYF